MCESDQILSIDSGDLYDIVIAELTEHFSGPSECVATLAQYEARHIAGGIVLRAKSFGNNLVDSHEAGMLLVGVTGWLLFFCLIAIAWIGYRSLVIHPTLTLDILKLTVRERVRTGFCAMAVSEDIAIFDNGIHQNRLISIPRSEISRERNIVLDRNSSAPNHAPDADYISPWCAFNIPDESVASSPSPSAGNDMNVSDNILSWGAPTVSEVDIYKQSFPALRARSTGGLVQWDTGWRINGRPSDLTRPDISTLIDSELFRALGKRISCLALLLDFSKGMIHGHLLTGSDCSIDSSSNKGEPCADCKPYLRGVLSIAVGLIASFYVFWNLQFSANYQRRFGRCIAILTCCFFLIAYGTYLLMEPAQFFCDTPQEPQKLAIIQHVSRKVPLRRKALDIGDYKTVRFCLQQSRRKPPRST